MSEMSVPVPSAREAYIAEHSPGGGEEVSDVNGMFALIIGYVLRVGHAPPEDYEELFAGMGPDALETYMTTTYEPIIERGRLEGRIEIRIATLTRLLTQKFGPLPQDHQNRIQHATLDELDTWTDRILNAGTLEDVFTHSS